MLVNMTIARVLTHAVKQILPNKEGLEKLMDSKKIRVYLGVDPTGPRLHLGHSIPLKKLQEFADLGHEAILLFGTGTVLAGDPSQRNEARGKITIAEIDENIKTWKVQAQKIINFDKIKIKYNGDWLLKLNYADVIKIASNISSTQLYKREMFQERIKRGQTVWTHETLYPLFQGYDSVAMDVDLEIGGTDQTFNMLIGRELQKKINKREKFVLTTPLISGTDGKPMSKSSGNCIWLNDTPADMFGKIMSMADIQIEEYWQTLTQLPAEKLRSLKPLDAKKMLANEIVKLYKGETLAKKAQKEFEAVYQKSAKPKHVDVNVQENISLTEAVSKFVSSKSQAKRLISQGAVEIDGQVATDGSVKTQKGQVLKIGKKTYVKVGK
ncbi:MAG: Tyrosine-tRNA ligase [Parcubacteria group bacterium GW2011_GWA1_36_12]|nr:MAG: Tyrosine-tRNA ligase [Parcubacteria group bacterium GW2011_GWA1_36_12]